MNKLIISSIIFGFALALMGCGESSSKKEPSAHSIFKANLDKKTELLLTFYKTSRNVPVNGTFTHINAKGYENIESKNIKDILMPIMFNIPTKTIDTKLEERNNKIYNSFFMIMKNTDIIHGKVVNVEGDNQKGICKILLVMNNIEQIIDFNYALVENKTISLNADIDITKWHGKEALDSLNSVCSILHTGDDEKSILSPTVSINIAFHLDIVNL